MSNFSIGIMADSLKLSFADSMKKARELGADGVQIYATKGEMAPENLTPALIAEKHRNCIDAPYFRLIHHLQDLPAPELPKGYSVCSIEPGEYAGHINSCYCDIGISEEELVRYTARRVCDPALWIAVKENDTGAIVATGIGELDTECGEGILEWIQVSEGYRRMGLGSYVVNELLRRMAGKAVFATVSGKCDDPTRPEQLYRKCGFTGNDVWHILRHK